MSEAQIDALNATLTEGADGAAENDPNRPLTRREQAMLEIEADNLRRLEEETGVKLTDNVPPVDDKAKLAEKQLEAQLNDEPQVLDPAQPGAVVKVKIDGEEQEVPLADVVRQFQKGSAADKRLNEATRILREAQEQAEQLRAAAAPAPAVAAQPVPTQEAPAAVPAELTQKAKDAFSKLYEGDEDAAAAALVALIQGQAGAQAATQAPAPVVDVDQLVGQVQQRLSESTAFNQAMDTIRRDYPEVINNTDFETLAAIKANQKIAAGASRAQAVLESAQEVYTNLGLKAAGRQQEETRDEKLKRKQELDIPNPVNASVPSQSQQEEETSVSSLIQQMALGRLGQTMPGDRKG